MTTRGAILAVLLVGVMVWTVTCGRNRTPEASDTPVPTLTIAPTLAATATSAPTATSAATATTEPLPTETEGADAGESSIASEVLTDSVEPESSPARSGTATEPVTVTASATQSISDTVPVAATETVSTEVALVQQESTTESVTGSPTTESTEAAEVTAPSSSTATEAAAETVNPEDTATNAPSETPAPTMTKKVSPTATEASTESVADVPASIGELTTETPSVDTTSTPSGDSTATPSATEDDATAESTPAPAREEPTEIVEPTASATPSVSATSEVTATESSQNTPEESETVAPTSTLAATPVVSVRSRNEISLPVELVTSVQITDVVLLTDLVEEALPMAAALSPDGTQIAWIEPEVGMQPVSLCLAEIDADVTTKSPSCHEVNGYQGMPYQLAWSPDGRWIAFSEDPAAQAIESDIWLFDTSNEELINRSDDDQEGRHAEVDGEHALDYLPMWDPATGYLYFWRSTPDEEGGFNLELMKLDPEGSGEAEVVRNFEQTLGDGLVRFGWQRFYLQGPSAISPDGSQLALSIAPAQEMDLSEGDKLWLIDLVDPSAEPVEIESALAWQEALPQWSSQPAVVRGLGWTPDGKGIVVAALSSDLRMPLLLAYYVDVESGEVTPVVDFSDSRERDAFFRIDRTTGHAPRFDAPWTVALAPNANTLLMVTDLAGIVRILEAPLPPNGEQPTVAHEHRSPGFEAWTRSSASEDGKLLVYGLLMQLLAGELTPD